MAKLATAWFRGGALSQITPKTRCLLRRHIGCLTEGSAGRGPPGRGTRRRHRSAGKLRSATGLLTCSLCAAVGELCEILPVQGPPVLAEVIGFQDDLSYLAPFDSHTIGVRGSLDLPLTGSGLVRAVHLELAVENYMRTNDLRMDIISWSTGFRF